MADKPVAQKDQQEKAQDQLEKAQDQQEKAQDQQEKAQDQLEKAQDQQEKAQDQQEKAQDQLENAQDQLEKAQARHEKAKARHEKAKAQHEKAQQEMDEALAAFNRSQLQLRYYHVTNAFAIGDVLAPEADALFQTVVNGIVNNLADDMSFDQMAYLLEALVAFYGSQVVCVAEDVMDMDSFQELNLPNILQGNQGPNQAD